MKAHSIYSYWRRVLQLSRLRSFPCFTCKLAPEGFLSQRIPEPRFRFAKAATEILSHHWEAHRYLKDSDTAITSETRDLDLLLMDLTAFSQSARPPAVQEKLRDCNSTPKKCCWRAQAENKTTNQNETTATNFPQTIFSYLVVGLPVKGKHMG